MHQAVAQAGKRGGKHALSSKTYDVTVHALAAGLDAVRAKDHGQGQSSIDQVLQALKASGFDINNMQRRLTTLRKEWEEERAKARRQHAEDVGQLDANSKRVNQLLEEMETQIQATNEAVQERAEELRPLLSQTQNLLNRLCVYGQRPDGPAGLNFVTLDLSASCASMLKVCGGKPQYGPILQQCYERNTGTCPLLIIVLLFTVLVGERETFQGRRVTFDAHFPSRFIL